MRVRAWMVLLLVNLSFQKSLAPPAARPGAPTRRRPPPRPLDLGYTFTVPTRTSPACHRSQELTGTGAKYWCKRAGRRAA